MAYSQLEEIHLIAWAVWGYVCLLNVLRYRWNYRSTLGQHAQGNGSPPQPAVVVWSPVKGLSDTYEAHLNRLLNQDYPDYRIVIALESKADPVFTYLHDRFELVPTAHDEVYESAQAPVRVVIAGHATDQGQKVHNLIAAYLNDEGYGQVIMTVDADALWEPHTINSLLAGLEKPKAGISMGYRWIVPQTASLPNLFASLINASVACILGPHFANSAWAGSMAIKRATFEKLQVVGHWKGKANDESVLMNLLTKNGLRAIYCPQVTPVTLADYNWKSVINFGRRQYIHQWVYRKILWFYGASFISFYFIGWAKCILLISQGSRVALACAIALYASDILRGIVRQHTMKEMLPEWTHSKLEPTWVWELFCTPVWFAFHWFLVWSTFLCNQFNWSGVRYVMTSKATTVTRPSSDTADYG